MRKNRLYDNTVSTVAEDECCPYFIFSGERGMRAFIGKEEHNESYSQPPRAMM
jgi:hypothetical protein